MASDQLNDDELTKEQRILRMTRRVLTDVAKDTMTPPGMKHPLSDDTIKSIRDCLQLIASREAEILALQGTPSIARPRFIDEPVKNVVVNLQPKKTGAKQTDPKK